MLPLTAKETIISDIDLPDLQFAANNLPSSWESKHHNPSYQGSRPTRALTELYVVY